MSDPIVVDVAPADVIPGPTANPVVGINATGEHIVVWQPLSLPGEGEPGYEELAGARLTGIIYRWDGSVLVQRFRVDQDVTCQFGEKSSVQNPTVSMDDDGDFAAAWDISSCDNPSGPRNVRAFRLARFPTPRVIKSEQAEVEWYNPSIHFGLTGNFGGGLLVGEEYVVSPERHDAV